MKTRKVALILFIIIFVYVFYQAWLAQHVTIESEDPDPRQTKSSILHIDRNFRDRLPDTSDYFKNIFNIGMTDIQQQRKHTIKAACKRNVRRYSNNITKYDIDQFMFTDERHRVMFCQIQKVGSSFMWDMMAKLNSVTKNVDKKKFRLNILSNLKIKKLADVHALLSDSFKIMFVRDPYDRLFAAYVDKMVSANTVYWNQFGATIKRTLHQHYKKPPYKNCGNDVTFPELIEYLIMSERDSSLIRDSHFNPMYDHCSPCQVRYDFIGKMETFKEDMMTIFNSWNDVYGSNIQFKNFSRESALTTAKNQIIRLFNFKEKWNQCISFYSALKREWRALQIRGILPIHVHFPFSEHETSELTTDSMYDAVKKAYENIRDKSLSKTQKKEAMLEAYSLVPRKLMNSLREVFEPDCELFGYDSYPDFLFHIRRNPKHKLKYFDILLYS